mgnify:CR=1 FL=1
MLLRKGAWFYAASVLVLVGLVVFWTIVDRPAAAEEPQDHQDPKRLREIVGLRDATSKTYELADGQREWVGYAEAVHYQDADETWRDIDNSIVNDSQRVGDTDYSLKNAANQYSVRFARQAAGANLVNISYRGTAIAFGPAGGMNAGVAKRPYSESQALSDMTYGNNCAVYEEVYPGVDLVYEAKTGGVKENIVLKDATVRNEFLFDLKLRDLSPKETDGRLVFVDDEDNEVFHLGPLLALDEAGVPCEEVTCALVEKGKKHQLKVAVSRAYLEDPARVFPVIIDPSVMITGSSVTYDSFVSSRYPYRNYYLYNWLRTGKDTSYYTRRTFIRFNLSSLSGVDPDQVAEAYIRIKRYSGVTPNITAYRVLGSWVSSTIKWSNMPGYTTSEHSTTAINDSGSWWRMYNLTVVKKWLAGTYGQYGWMIKDSREYSTSLWTTFYSSDAPSPNKPELHIIYKALPAYTYTSSACSYATRSDPINVFFGGTVGDGYFGTLQGVIDGVCGSLGHTWTEVANHVPPWVQYQYVKFRSTSGAYAAVRHNERSIGTGSLCDRYHARLFLNPYAYSTSYAEKNTVTSVHFDDWTGSGHVIGEDWEVSEGHLLYRLDDEYPLNDCWHDVWYNGGLDQQGFDSNGWMSVVYLSP